MAVHFSLMKACTRPSNSSTLRFTAIEKSGSTSLSTGRWVVSKSAARGDLSGNRADELVLIVEGGHHQGAHAILHRQVLEGGAPRLRRQVTHDDRPSLSHGALVHRAREILALVVGGVGKDARLVRARAMVEVEHALAPDGGQTELQFGAAEEDAQLVLEGLEARRRDDRLAVDEITLERGEHLVVGHVDRAEKGKAGDHKPVGGENLAERRPIEKRFADPLGRVRRQRRDGPARADLDEPWIEGKLEVPFEPDERPGDAQHDGVVERELDTVDLTKHDLVGAQHVDTQGRALVDVDPPLEHSVGAAQRPVERRRPVKALHAEGQEGGRVVLVPGRGREDGGHQRFDERPVARQEGEVVNRLEQFGCLAKALADLAAKGPEHRVVPGRQ